MAAGHDSAEAQYVSIALISVSPLTKGVFIFPLRCTMRRIITPTPKLRFIVEFNGNLRNE